MIKLNHKGVLNMMKQSEYAAKNYNYELKLKVLKELLEIAKIKGLKIKNIIISD